MENNIPQKSWDKEPKLKPLSLGIISDPPTLVLCYEKVVVGVTNNDDDGRTGTFDQIGVGEGQTKKMKRRKRKMPLRNFTDRSNVTRVAFAIRQRHEEYLRNVLTVTIEKMLRVIQEIQKGVIIEDAVKKVNKEYELNPEEDLNKLSTEELLRKKAIMDENFRQNLLQPGDPGYVYDKVEEFEKDEEKLKPCEWDEENEDNPQGRESKNGEDKPDTTQSKITTTDAQGGEGEETKDVKIDDCKKTVDMQHDKSGRSIHTHGTMVELIDKDLEKKEDKLSMMKISVNVEHFQSESDAELDEVLELDIETGMDLKLDDDDDFWA